MHGIVRDKESTSFSYSSRCFYIEPVHFICTNALCCVSIENEFRFPLRNRFFNYLLKDVESFLFPDLSRKASSELVWHITYSVASNKHPFWRRKQPYSLYSATSRTGALGRRLSIHNGFWKQTILKFFGKRTTNIHKFDDCSPRGQVSNVFNGCIVEP